MQTVQPRGRKANRPTTPYAKPRTRPHRCLNTCAVVYVLVLLGVRCLRGLRIRLESGSQGSLTLDDLALDDLAVKLFAVRPRPPRARLAIYPPAGFRRSRTQITLPRPNPMRARIVMMITEGG